MDFFKINNQGPIFIEKVSALPTWSSADEGRLVYVESNDTLYYGTSLDFIEVGSGSGASIEYDMYADLLSQSIYDSATYDGFDNEDLTDSTTTMTFDFAENYYTFTDAKLLQSNNLFDSVSGLSSVDEAMISVDFTLTVGSTDPTIRATMDGINWEVVTNNSVHTFSNAGTTLKLRVNSAAGTIGYVSSYAVLYNSNPSSINTTFSKRKVVNFYYEGTAVDEQDIISGFYFDNNIIIDKVTINARVAPTGSSINIDLIKNGAEQSNIADLTATSSYKETSLTPLSYNSTDRFGLKIKQIGSTQAGQGLNISVHYYDN